MEKPSTLPAEIVPISRLFCSPTNPRRNDAAVPHVACSLRRFGWQQPIVARKSGEVIAGNTRLKAAQSLGMQEVPVWWFDGTDLDATAFSIADNRTHEFAEWNNAELAKLLEHLKAEDSLDGRPPDNRRPLPKTGARSPRSPPSGACSRRPRSHGARDRRFGRVPAALDAAPVRRHLLREEYEWFRDFGELSEDDALAYEVVLQALRGGDEQDDEPKARGKHAYWTAVGEAHPGVPETVRDRLFYEALFEPSEFRALARATIAVEVAHGGNVESPSFAERFGMPAHQSVALHTLGYPGKLAVTPYEQQARRLFVRMDELRDKLGEHDEAWTVEQAEVTQKFLQSGELPRDELRLEAVLIQVEIGLLTAHKQGLDVAAGLELCAKVARGDGEALLELGKRAKAGRLVPRGKTRARRKALTAATGKPGDDAAAAVTPASPAAP